MTVNSALHTPPCKPLPPIPSIQPAPVAPVNPPAAPAVPPPPPPVHPQKAKLDKEATFWVKHKKTINIAAKVFGSVALVGGIVSLLLTGIVAVPIVATGAALGFALSAISFSGAKFASDKATDLRALATRYIQKHLKDNLGSIQGDALHQSIVAKWGPHVTEFTINAQTTFRKKSANGKKLKQWQPKEINLYFQSLAAACPNIKHLSLQGLPSKKGINFSQLSRMSLTRLSLFNCGLSDRQFAQFGSQQKLKQLRINECHNLTQFAFKVFENSPIHTFQLLNSRLIFDFQKFFLKTYHGEVKNRIGKLYDPPQGYDKIVKSIAEKERQKIVDTKWKDIHNQYPIVSEDKLDFLFKWKKLRHLEISHLDDKSLEKILQHPKLYELSLKHTYDLTCSGLAKMPKKCQLRVLAIDDVYGFNADSFKYIKDAYQLRMVIFKKEIYKFTDNISGDYKNLWLQHQRFFDSLSPKFGNVRFKGAWQRRTCAQVDSKLKFC